jgi:hypothetical protein
MQVRMLVGYLLCFVTVGSAQQTQSTAAVTAVPRLVRFAGSFQPAVQQPAGLAGATFAIFNEQEGGTALWTEEQNVELDAAGNYSVLLGSTKNGGMPAELFGASEPRWLQVSFHVPDAADSPRVLLVSVPYAFKAVDADTLGGKPASAYLMAAAPAAATTEPAIAAPVNGSARPEAVSGTLGYIPYFDDTSSDLGSSVIYQSSAGNIGIGTASPGQLLTLQTGATGYTFLENIFGSVDPGNGATRLEVGNPVSTLMLTAYGSQSPGILAGSAGVVSLAGPLLVGNAAQGAPLYLYAGNAYTAPQFTLTSTGFVGIGTLTPATTLEVNGNAQVDGNLTLSGAILSPGSSVPLIQAPSNGSNNFSAGLGALPPATTGTQDTAVGDSALQFNTTGNANTAVGSSALQNNITGGDNTATGNYALQNNINGSGNTASGVGALYSNVNAYNNTASGFYALYNNSGGNQNTASGVSALSSNTTGSQNTASGGYVLESNITGNSNTAVGNAALSTNVTGSSNIAIGLEAGVAITTTSNNIDIGNGGVSGDSGAIRIGAAGVQLSAFIAGIYGVTTSASNAVPVMIDSNGNLGTISSSRRYKDDIQDMGDASSGLMRLRPVTFRYKKAFNDGSKPIQYGLIAEEVAEVYPDLVARSADGQIETVKYQVLDSMLLNELHKQNAMIDVQREQIRSLEERLGKVEAALGASSR